MQQGQERRALNEQFLFDETSATRTWNGLLIADSVIQRPPYVDDDTPSSTAAATMDFHPPKYIRNMNNAPRFGHTNRIGLLASSDPDQALDYANGLKRFSLFIIVPFLIWAIILVLLKFLYGIEKIGCAAGGDVLDIKALAKQGMSRKLRRRRILRSWRLQSVFLCTGLLIPTCSLIMMHSGWSQLEMAWAEVREVVNDVESLAFRGYRIVRGLEEAREALIQNGLVQAIQQSSSRAFESWCPNANNAEGLAILQNAMDTLQDNTQSIVDVLQYNLQWQSDGFESITEATDAVNQSIEWFFEQDWIWKLYLMILNVLTIFMMGCVFIFSRHNILHSPTRYYLVFWVVPLFCAATTLLLMVTGSSGVAMLLNADFCSGGEAPSPTGTIRDAMISYQHGSLTNDELTGTLGLVYDAFEFYAEGCLAENPLHFLVEYSRQVDQVTAYVIDLRGSLPHSEEAVNVLNQECGADMSFLPGAMVELEKEMLSVQTHMSGMVQLSRCHSISPLLRRLTHGAVCEESAHGLTWIWGSSLFICICCFVMLSTRAALYNGIKKRKKRDKKSKKVVEREFEEYKEFMAQFYEDAHEWKLAKKKLLEIEFGSQIGPNPTFETQPTSSMDNDDNTSQQGGILSLSCDGDDDSSDEEKPAGRVVVTGAECEIGEEDQTWKEDFNSDYESDSDISEDDGDDDESALHSFLLETRSLFTETKSILSETKSLISGVATRTMKKLRPLLGQDPSKDEEDEDRLFPPEDSFFLHSPRQTSPMSNKSHAQMDDDKSSIAGAEGDDDYITPPPKLPLLGLATPAAPYKAYASFRRRDDDAVMPRKLLLSPMSDEREEKAPLNESTESKNYHLTLDLLGSKIRDARCKARSRSNSVDSNAISIYVDDEDDDTEDHILTPVKVPNTPGLTQRTKRKTVLSPKNDSTDGDESPRPKASFNSSGANRPFRLQQPPPESRLAWIQKNWNPTQPPKAMHRRQSSESSQDISLYIEEDEEKSAPSKPTKRFARLSRTSKEHES